MSRFDVTIEVESSALLPEVAALIVHAINEEAGSLRVWELAVREQSE